MKKKIMGVLAGIGLCLSAQAADSAWTLDGNGNWNVNANWDGNYPGAVSPSTTSPDTAYFTNSITADRTITIPSSYNIGSIAFGNTSANAYIVGAQALRVIYLSNGGVIQSLAGTGIHNDQIGSKLALVGDGGSYTFRNDSTVGGLLINKAVSGSSTAGNTTTLYLDGSSTVTSIGGQNTAVGAAIDDGGNGGKLAVVKNGNGLWTLSGNNTFTGGLAVNAGTIRYFGNGSTCLGAGSVTIADGVTFNKANNSTVLVNNQMIVNGNFEFKGNSDNNDWSGAMDLAAGTRTITANANLTVSGGISNGGLTKAGSAVLTLSGANIYSGGTTVSGGTLLINGDNSGATGAVTVDAGGVLGGSGIIGGAVTVNADGTLSAGNSPGTLAFNDNLTLSTGSTNIMEISDTAYDILTGDGANALVVAGETVFDFTLFSGGVTNGYSIALADMFVNWASVDLTGATYSAAGLGAGQSLDLTGGNLTVIPEPATLGLVIALGAGLVWVRRVFMV